MLQSYQKHSKQCDEVVVFFSNIEVNEVKKMNGVNTQDKFYENTSAKTGILLFHAYTGTPNDFNLLARHLQRLGYEVFCPMFLGHGTQEIEDILEHHPEDWWIQAQQKFEWMQQRGYEKLVVMGLSLGGVYATRLLTVHHDSNVIGGVFNSPVYPTKPVDVWHFFNLYAEYLYKKQQRLAEYERKREQIYELYRRQIEEIQYFITSFQMDLQEINCPFYIAQSGADEMINRQDAMLLKDVLINAQVDFHWFEDNTHVITTNRNREAFESSVVEFIERY